MRRLTCALAITALALLSPLARAAEAPRGAQVAPRLMPAELKPIAPSKIDTALARAAAAADPLEAARKAAFRVRDGRIQIYVIVREGAAANVMAWLEAHDASWISAYGEIVQAHVMPETLGLLEQQSDVLAVHRPVYIQPSDHELCRAALRSKARTFRRE